MRIAVTRRQFIAGLAGGGVAAVAGGSYMRFFEPHWLEISRQVVRITPASAASHPVRIVHLSDFHASRAVSFEFIDEAVTEALAQQPDIIAVTGDFFTDRLKEIGRYAQILRRLSSAAPTFACLGNHDGGPWTRSAGGNPTIDEALALLRQGGLTCLHNAAAAVSVRGRALQFIGVGDLWSGMCDPGAAFARVPARGAALRILLNHNPDAKRLLRPFDWDLVLCGHTHGGQLKLPLLGTPFVPVEDRRYVEGLHRWEERWLYITRGVGNLHGLRFNCRPEISVLEIL